MHLVEAYATSSGLKINKPYIYTNFFPITSSKYICFHPFSKFPAKNYDYWQEVINIIYPYLKEKNIDIIQIGTKNDKRIDKCIHISGQTNINQAAYIVQNCILHLGADSFASHIASGFEKKIVAIYSNNNIENVKPYWSRKEDVALISPKSNRKPCQCADENPKFINKIKPEEIAKEVLNLLDIKHNELPETVYIGPDYTSKTLEVIPDGELNISNLNLDNIIIRMDYVFNEKNLEILVRQKKSIIITNKPINLEILKSMKNNILQVVYEIKNDNDYNFIINLKKLSINYAMISYLKDSDLNDFKINYMDYGLIHQKKYPEKINFNYNLNELKYMSSRILLSSEGQFCSKYHWLNKTENIIDDKEYWKELDSFFIYKP